MIKASIFIFSLIFFITDIFSQSALVVTEIQIQEIHKQILPGNSIIQNQKLADSINNYLENALNLPEAIKYPFDSLKFLGKINSEDENVRILTWNLPLADGTNRYFGFIIFKPSEGETRVFRLTDISPDMTGDEFSELTADNWYGCLVYDIIDIKYSGDTWYTLLGYDPNNIFITRKLIDVLWFRDNKPVFGKPVFRNKTNLQYRIFFKYSAKVQMTLKWDQRLDMIVFDHLSPSDPAYKDNFTYYGPDFTYNGLKLEKGIWVLHENIDVRGK